jgi:N-acyl homoserine lactone hydrolase
MAGTEVELEVMLAGEVRAPRAWVFRPPGGLQLARLAQFARGFKDTISMPLLAYVIRHPEAGPIAVDTGLHPDAARSVREDYGAVNGVVFGSLRAEPESYPEQLSGLGVDPHDVRLAVMTHLHADHTSGMRLLPNAEFACGRREWAAATGRLAFAGGYAPRHLPEESAMRLIDWNQGVGHGPFARTIDLLGDGSLRLISTPGHSPGHMSVLVRVAGRGEVLIVGDAVYTLESLRERILPFRTDDDERYLDSLRQLRAYADANPEAPLIPTHDAQAWREYAAA